MTTAFSSFTGRVASIADEETPSFKSFFHTCTVCKIHNSESAPQNNFDDVPRLAGVPVGPINIPSLAVDATTPAFVPPDRCDDSAWVIRHDRVIDASVIATHASVPSYHRDVIHLSNEKLFYHQMHLLQRACSASIPGATLAYLTFTTVMRLIAKPNSSPHGESMFLSLWVNRDFVAFTDPLFRQQHRPQRSSPTGGSPPCRVSVPARNAGARMKRIKDTLRSYGPGRAAASLDRPGIAPRGSATSSRSLPC